MANTSEYIMTRIAELNPMHAKKLKKSISPLGPDYQAKAEEFYQKYIRVLSKQGKTIDYGIDCYLKMCDDVIYESVRFFETGKYANSSFAEVNASVYNNPAVMEYYMHGLLMSEMLWHHHYKVYLFFKKNFPTFVPKIKRYLEIGGGHGLFTQEAVNLLPNASIDVVDISSSSIELSKQFVEGGKVNYNLTDVFEFYPASLFDCIVMGEVLEHVEDPLALMKKINSLLNDDGVAYITAPTNAPAIDHISLFRNREDIVKIIDNAGFKIIEESCIYAENVTKEVAEELKISMMYAVFLKKK